MKVCDKCGKSIEDKGTFYAVFRGMEIYPVMKEGDIPDVDIVEAHVDLCSSCAKTLFHSVSLWLGRDKNSFYIKSLASKGE